MCNVSSSPKPFFSKVLRSLIWIEAVEAPPQESWKARRPQRWKRPAHWGREKKNCSGSSAIISYQPIQTTSPTAWSVRVCVCMGAKQRETETQRTRVRERATQRATQRERERAGKGEAPYSFTYPPSNHRKEGPDPKLPIKSARGSRHYLSNKLLTDYMSRSLVHDWRKPFFYLVTFPLYFPPPPTNIRMTF